MSNFKKYPIKDFSTNQKFLADDPNQVVRVTGQSMLDANIEAMKKSGKVVNSIDTLTEAIAGDYLSGIYLLVGGGVVTLDGDQAIYRVSDAGSGGIGMANGNELVLLFVANTPENIVTPIDSVASLFGLTGVAGQQISVGEYNAGSNVGNFGAIWRDDLARSAHDGVEYFSPDRDLTTEGETAYRTTVINATLGVWENKSRLNGKFTSVANLKDGLSNSTDRISPAQIDAKDIPATTNGYYGAWNETVEPSGGAEYLLTTLQRVRDSKSDGGWIPDGFGDHYMTIGDGATYVAMLQINTTTGVRQFGAKNGTSSADDVSANIQACNDHSDIGRINLGKIDCYAQGLVINKNLVGDSMVYTRINALDNLSPVITVPTNTRRRNMSDFAIVGTSKAVAGSIGIKLEHNVSRGKFRDIDIVEVESGIFSADDASLFMFRFEGILVDESNIAFNLQGFTEGYTTITMVNCYATNCDIGFFMSVHFDLVMINCAVDYTTGSPYVFQNCNQVVMIACYSEGCDLSALSSPALIQIQNCSGFTLDGFFSFNHTSALAYHFLIFFNDTTTSKNIEIKHTHYDNGSGGDEYLFKASGAMTSATNVIFSGVEQTDYQLDGDLKIRNLDYTSISARSQTDAAGKVVLDLTGIPGYLGKAVTASAGGSSGAPADHITRVEQGGTFANVYIADFNGVIDATAGVNVNTLISCTRN